MHEPSNRFGNTTYPERSIKRTVFVFEWRKQRQRQNRCQLQEIRAWIFQDIDWLLRSKNKDGLKNWFNDEHRASDWERNTYNFSTAWTTVLRLPFRSLRCFLDLMRKRRRRRGCVCFHRKDFDFQWHPVKGRGGDCQSDRVNGLGPFTINGFICFLKSNRSKI